MKDFLNNFMCEPKKETQKQNKLKEIAKKYHKFCDAYDYIFCSGKNKYGESIPTNNEELKKINKNALYQLSIALDEGEMLGFINQEVKKAIKDYYL